TDGAPPAVAADHVAGAQAAAACGRQHLNAGTVAVVAEPDDLMGTVQAGAQAGGPFGEHGFGQRLWLSPRPVGASFQHAVVDGQAAEMADRYGLQITETGQQPTLIELLDGPGREPQST